MKKQEPDSPLKRAVKNKSHAGAGEVEKAKDEVWLRLKSSRSNTSPAPNNKKHPWLWAAAAVVIISPLLLTVDWARFDSQPAPQPVAAGKLKQVLNSSGFPGIAGSTVKTAADFAGKLYETPEAFTLDMQSGSFAAVLAGKPAKPLLINALKSKIKITGTTFSVSVREDKLVVGLYEGGLHITSFNGGTTGLKAGQSYEAGKVAPMSKTTLSALGSFYQKTIGKPKPKQPVFVPTHTITLKDGSEFRARLLKGDAQHIRIRLAGGKEQLIPKSDLQFMQPLE